jgi:hypothetical protein
MSKITDLVTKFVEDVATLDVLTLSGTIALKPDAAADSTGDSVKELNWDSYFKNVVEKVKTPDDDSKIEIVAYTHTEFDADSVNFYRSAAGEDSLRELHLKTVESATKARMDAVAAFARIFT